ncbi:hypothetical protein MNBD_UNCLBAC01-923 [hydrothermal vent metagenome]|uniref:Methanolan biosynthesis EpsI domain-containing protein n=1 Tax=hydrothermal vent metagenome TaxID=652676 RepID=A0A3B1DKU7_9ZZZZ
MKKSYIFIITLFFLSGFFSWRLYFQKYSQNDTVSIHEFPKVIGEWISEEIPISDKDYEILETRNAFTRRYTHSQTGVEVYLFIIYSQNNRKVSHPPELCYTGSGATVLSKKPEIIGSQQSIETVQVVVEYTHTQQVLNYWFKVGESFTPSYWKQQLLIAVKTFTGKPASSALIRISSTVKEGGQKKASKDIDAFASAMHIYIPQYLP